MKKRLEKQIKELAEELMSLGTKEEDKRRRVELREKMLSYKEKLAFLKGKKQEKIYGKAEIVIKTRNDEKLLRTVIVSDYCDFGTLRNRTMILSSRCSLVKFIRIVPEGFIGEPSDKIESLRKVKEVRVLSKEGLIFE